MIMKCPNLYKNLYYFAANTGLPPRTAEQMAEAAQAEAAQAGQAPGNDGRGEKGEEPTNREEASSGDHAERDDQEMVVDDLPDLLATASRPPIQEPVQQQETGSEQPPKKERKSRKKKLQVPEGISLN